MMHKLEILREQIKATLGALDRGEFIQISDSQKESYFEEISTRIVRDLPAKGDAEH